MGIETYLTVAFWASLLGIIVRSISISTLKYPRKEEHNLGFDVFMLLISIAVFVWICFLKYGGIK